MNEVIFINKIHEFILLNRSNDNEHIQDMSIWIHEFIIQPLAIPFLLNILPKFQDLIERQMIIILIWQAIKNSWNHLDYESQNGIIVDLMKEILIEKSWINKQNLICSISLIMSDQYIPLVFEFIQLRFQQILTDDFIVSNMEIEGILLLLNVIIKEHCLSFDEKKIQNLQQILPFIFHVLSKGILSNHLEVQLAELEVIISTPYLSESGFLNLHQEYFAHFISLFDSFMNTSVLVSKFCKLMTNAISLQCIKPELIIILVQDILKYMSCHFLDNETSSLNVSNLFLSNLLLEEIFSYYTLSIYESEFWKIIIQMDFEISKKLFNPNDPLSISDAGFFKNVFYLLCSNEEISQCIWIYLKQFLNFQFPYTIFIFLTSLSSILQRSSSFFIQDYSLISQVIIFAFNSNFSILMDSAAIVLNNILQFLNSNSEFQQTETIDIISFSSLFFEPFLKGFWVYWSFEYLEILKHLMESFFKVHYHMPYFNEIINRLLQIIDESPPNIQVFILSILSKMCLYYSDNAKELFSFLFPIVISLIINEEKQWLHPGAIKLIKSLIKSVGKDYIIQTNQQQLIIQLLSYFISLVNHFFDQEGNEINICDINSALKCIDSITLLFQDTFIPMSIFESLFPFIIKISANDISSEYYSLTIFDEEFENDLPTPNICEKKINSYNNPPKVKLSYICIHLIGDLISVYPQLLEQIGITPFLEIIKCHKFSFSVRCKVAVINFIGQFSLAFSKISSKKDSLDFWRIFFNYFSTENNELLEAIFHTAVILLTHSQKEIILSHHQFIMELYTKAYKNQNANIWIKEFLEYFEEINKCQFFGTSL